MRRPSVKRFCLAVLLALVFAGCGSGDDDYYSKVDLVDVRGVVELEGEPVEGAVIVLQDVKTDLQSYALTDSAGEFRMRFDSVKYGVIPGEKMVIISTTMKIPGLNTDVEAGDGEEEPDGGRKKQADRIPKAYRGKSVLRATISESTSALNFNLAADGSTRGPE